MQRKNLANYRQLLMDNTQDVRIHNAKVASQMPLFLAALTLIPIFVLMINQSFAPLPLYIVVFTFCICLVLVYRYTPLKKYPLPILYLCAAVFFSFEIYLSVVNSPTHRATILLVTFCVMPILILDKRYRVAIFCSFFFIVHTVLSFLLKGIQIGFDDLINCLCVLIIGLYVGNLYQQGQLKLYEVNRELVIEKETDVLTSLANRRKLFDSIAKFDAQPTDGPTGILMLDIDYFKDYNDRYGHACGDECLRAFGRLLKSFEEMYDMKFYRYGGEEFVALVWDCNVTDLMLIAESIRVATQKMKLKSSKITASIGAAIYQEDTNPSYEYWLGKADDAIYIAKEQGRNTVVLHQ